MQTNVERLAERRSIKNQKSRTIKFLTFLLYGLIICVRSRETICELK